MSKQNISQKNQRIKMLKFCIAAGCKIETIAGKHPDSICLFKSGSVLKPCRMSDIDDLVYEGLIVVSEDIPRTTSAGKMHLRRTLSTVDEFQQQHQLLGTRDILTEGIVVSHNTNEGESPLTRLRYRKGKNGVAYIDDAEFQAGERLRADFSRGQLTQQLTSNWSVTESEGGSSNGRNGVGDLTDTALGARKRTQQAIASVGPELAGILIDICCFLKGLELVEKERQWPPRAAKLMLKTGLSILARHYGFSTMPSGNQNNSTSFRHWGTSNYKPEMFVD